MFDINPWGLTSIATTVVACSFAVFLWKTAVPTPVTRRFTVLLLVEVVTVLTSSAGIFLLFNFNVSERTEMVLDAVHHVGDVLMLALYPTFVAYALPLKVLKPLTTVPFRIAIWTFGAALLIWVFLDHAGIVTSGVSPDMALYSAMVIMFVVIFIFSLVSVGAASTKLAREKALAFVCAFGIRDLAWATVYFAAAAGWAEKPALMILITQLYAGAALLYIPIVTYGILKVQLLDIEVRLKSTIRNMVLAGLLITAFYVFSEVTNEFISEQLGGIVGFVVCAVLAVFLSPLHKWAERVAARLVNADTERPDYASNRSLQIYSAALEEAQAYGEVTIGQLALLDRLRESLELSPTDAERLERNLQFNRAAVSG